MKRGVRHLLAACVLGVAPGAMAATVLDSSLRLTAEERYDDDFRLSEDSTGGQLMTKLTPRLGLEMKDPRTTGEAFYATDLLMRHGSGKTTLDHRAGLQLRHVLSRRLRLDFTPYYLVNGVEVDAGPALRAWLERRSDVDRVLLSPRLRPLPQLPARS